MNIIEDAQPEQKVIDFDPSLGDFVDDHHRKDDTQARRYEQ
jgi:hypothetical protein